VSVAAAARLPAPVVRSGDRTWMRRLHRLLAAQSALLILASLNRLTGIADVTVLPHGSLRLLELINLLVLPPLSVLAFYLLLEQLLEDASRRVRRALRIAFLGSVYLFALSYGMHEPANFLHGRYCSGEPGALCQAIAYQDDGLSHLLFFAGFAGIDAVLLVAACFGPVRAMTRSDLALVLANGSLVAAAIVANLGFEAIGLDLFVVAAVAALALWLLWRFGPRAVIVYFASAYAAGLVLTAAVRLA
jgi:hypothetical protein